MYFKTVANWTLLTFWVVFVATPILRAQNFPYIAQVIEDETTVYSSPGNDGYETQKLKAGDKVEVYQVNPDGWAAVRPPIGSFSWVSGSYLEVGLDNIGTVKTDQLSSRVGSQLGEMCKTVQIQLKMGEKVVLLDRVETPENEASPIWYKIVPPAGEFRWIQIDAVVPMSHQKPNLNNNQILQVNYQNQPDGLESQSPISETTNQASGNPSRTRQVFNPIIASANPGMDQQPHVSMPGGVVRQPMQPSDPYQRALMQLNQEVRNVMRYPTEDWVFDALIQKCKTLYDAAPGEAEKLRTHQLIGILEKTRNTRKINAYRRQQANVKSGGKMTQQSLQASVARQIPPNLNGSNPMPNYPPSHPQNTASNVVQNAPMPGAVQANYVQRDRIPSSNPDSPFKAVGRLGKYTQRPEGYPPYAVVDESNQVVALITPQTGVDLNPYINKQVGINGSNGIYVDPTTGQKVQHVGASSIFKLDIP